MVDEVKKVRRSPRDYPRARVAHPGGVHKMYPPGTPLDQHGTPLQEVDMSASDVQKIGALDALSAKQTQQYRLELDRMTKGIPTKWNGDERLCFDQLLERFPAARISFVQISPNVDKNIPPKPITYLRDYDGMVQYLRTMHWRGQRAEYQWFAKASGLPRIAQGKVEFEERPEMANGNSNQQPPQGGGGGWVPPGGGWVWGPQGWYYMPGQVGGFPPGGYPPQTAPGYPPHEQVPVPNPAPAPVAAPPAPPADPRSFDPYHRLFELYDRMFQAHMAAAQFRPPFFPPPGYAPPGYGSPMPAGAPPPSVAGAPQQEQLQVHEEKQSPESVLEKNLTTAERMLNVTKRFAAAFAPPLPPEEKEPEAPVAQAEDNFPMQTKEINGVTWGAVDGQMLDAKDTALLNIPKAGAMVGGLLDKVFDRFEKLSEKVKQSREKEIVEQRERVELEERQLRARAEAKRTNAEIEERKARVASQNAYSRMVSAQADAFAGAQVLHTSPPPPPPPSPPTISTSGEVVEAQPNLPPPNGAE